MKNAIQTNVLAVQNPWLLAGVLLGVMLFPFLSHASSSPSATTVTTSAALASALASAKGGETIYLNGNSFTMPEKALRNKAFAKPVVIQGASRSGETVIEGMTLRDVDGLTFRNITFKKDVAQVWEIIVRLYSVKNMSFENSTFSGVVPPQIGAEGIGFSLSGSDNVKIINSKFKNLYIGAGFGTSKNILIAGNTFSELRKDGMNFSEGVHNVVIDRNVMRDFIPNWTLGDHPDHIQFWSKADTGASSNITITNNLLLVVPAQGIFMRGDYNNPNKTPRFTNLTINNNYYVGGMRNGISINSADNAKVTNNIIVGKGVKELAPGVRALSAQISVSGKNSVVSGNTANLYPTKTADPRVAYSNNTTVAYGVVPPVPQNLAYLLQAKQQTITGAATSNMPAAVR